MKTGIGRTGLLIAIVIASSTGEVVAQDLPAVSALNGKLDYLGGSMNSAEGHNFSGSLSLPIGEAFGLQADALYSRISDLDFYGGAGHVFWRDPDTGLFGLAGGYLRRDGVETFQVGAEGEYYIGRLTLGAFAGLGSISYDSSAPFIDTNPTRFVGELSAGYYPIDDLLIRLSYTTAFENNLGKAEAEYQIPIAGLAFTAEGAVGDNGYDHWLVGIRYYFGNRKSLRDRHRQDDPPGMMQQILHGLGLYGSEFNRKAERYIAEHGGSSGGVYGVYAMRLQILTPWDPGAAVPPGTGVSDEVHGPQ